MLEKIYAGGVWLITIFFTYWLRGFIERKNLYTQQEDSEKRRIYAEFIEKTVKHTKLNEKESLMELTQAIGKICVTASDEVVKRLAELKKAVQVAGIGKEVDDKLVDMVSAMRQDVTHNKTKITRDEIDKCLMK